MKTSSLMLISILTIGNVRCSDIEYAAPDKVESVHLASDENFEVKLRGLPEPNKYKAEVSYLGPSPGNWTVIRKSKDLKVTSFDLQKARAGSLEDLDLKSGETYKYLIGKSHDGEFQIAKEIEITIPEDLVISGLVHLKDVDLLKTADPLFRIFFTKDSVLKTDGADVQFEVEEIYSENGKLQTFSETAQTPLGQNGRHSGHVNLKAKRIDGPLTIEIRGERGGEGSKGATGPIGSTGAPSSIPSLDTNWEQTTAGGRVCHRDNFNNYGHQICPNLSYEECRLKFHRGVGGKGGPGGVGFQGAPGLRGGDAQSSNLDIPLGENIKIIFEPGIPGIGGKGGDGGPGGPGGLGAPLTNNVARIPCDPSPIGPTGDPGPEGPRGPDGIPGQKEQLTLNGAPQ